MYMYMYVLLDTLDCLFSLQCFHARTCTQYIQELYIDKIYRKDGNIQLQVLKPFLLEIALSATKSICEQNGQSSGRGQAHQMCLWGCNLLKRCETSSLVLRNRSTRLHNRRFGETLFSPESSNHREPPKTFH